MNLKDQNYYSEMIVSPHTLVKITYSINTLNLTEHHKNHIIHTQRSPAQAI